MSELALTQKELEARARAEYARAVKAAKSADMAPVVLAKPDDVPEGSVRCRVMKKGDDRIFTGEMYPLKPVKFPRYAKGDVCIMDHATAEKYEDEGMVEIL